ncbi:efflux RND transporter periplasmic adaptor subunit [Chloroflexota bacterium]
MKKKVKLGLILALTCLIVVSLSACGTATKTEQQFFEVTKADLVMSVSADGNLSLPSHRKLTFGIPGTIVEINVEEGDKVTKGQVLARLDTTSLELAVRTAEIDLEKATDSYRRLTYPYDFRTWALDVPASAVFVMDALREVEDAMEVMQKLGLSREQYSWEQYWDVFGSLQIAQDDLIKAKERLIRGYGEDVFESGILRMTDLWTLRAAQLEMEKAQLDLENAKKDMEKAVIIAPIDGVITPLYVKEQENVSSFDYATRIIIELIDPSHMELDAEVDEIDIPGVRLGQKAVISVDALPDLQLNGKVTSISPLSTEESGLILYKVKIGFDVPEGLGLKSGMSAGADVVIEQKSSVLLVPNRAVGQDSSGNPVVKVMVDEQIEERPVVIGASDGFQTEIVDGVNEGEIVVIERQVKVEEGGGGFLG